MEIFAAIFLIVYFASFAAPAMYVRYRKLTGFQAAVWTFYMFILIPGFGQFFYLYYLNNYYLKDVVAKKDAKKKYERYSEEREQFFVEYGAMQRTGIAETVIKASVGDRDEIFFRAFPNAKLFVGPRNADDFEFIAESWMKYWGIVDAEKTRKGSDGGIDVFSSRFIAQVKFYADKKVIRPEVQQLYGVAQANNVGSLFFAYSSGYTLEALEWAENQGMACFTFEEIEDKKRFEFVANTSAAFELSFASDGINYEEYNRIKHEEQRVVDMELLAERYLGQKLTEDSFYRAPQRGLGFL